MCQFHQHFTRSFYTRRSQKRKTTLSWPDCLFALSGSTHVKAVRRRLMKLTPAYSMRAVSTNFNRNGSGIKKMNEFCERKCMLVRVEVKDWERFTVIKRDGVCSEKVCVYSQTWANDHLRMWPPAYSNHPFGVSDSVFMTKIYLWITTTSRQRVFKLNVYDNQT